MAERKPYRVLDHTADIGLEAHGQTLKKLFENAAAGFYALLVKGDDVRTRQTVELSIRAHDSEALFVRFLQELNYLYQTQRLVGGRVEVQDVEDRALHALVRGETLDPQRHTVLRDIKAVTYHGLTLKKVRKKSWKATVLFDV
jgi:SHS2 domain-containing protein